MLIINHTLHFRSRNCLTRYVKHEMFHLYYTFMEIITRITSHGFQDYSLEKQKHSRSVYIVKFEIAILVISCIKGHVGLYILNVV